MIMSALDYTKTEAITRLMREYPGRYSANQISEKVGCHRAHVYYVAETRGLQFKRQITSSEKVTAAKIESKIDNLISLIDTVLA